MTEASWNVTVIAESEDTVVVEGNHYFPPDTVRWDLLTPSSRQTTCPWKHVARYYDITVDGKVNRHAAWQYQDPKALTHARDQLDPAPTRDLEPGAAGPLASGPRRVQGVPDPAHPRLRDPVEEVSFR